MYRVMYSSNKKDAVDHFSSNSKQDNMLTCELL